MSTAILNMMRRFIAALVSVLIPLIPLLPLLSLHNSFYLDWNNHVWMVAYFGEYFLHHGAFPIVLNTHTLVGLPFPVFYGFLFYPAAGLLSAAMGANLAIRLLLFGVLWLQCYQVRKTLSLVVDRPALVWGMTLLTATAVYPMTNLYNRSALTEVVSTWLLLSAFCCLLRILLEPSRSPWVNGLSAGLFFVLSAGTHPITAMVGSVLLLLWTLAILWVARFRPALWRAGACAAVLFALVMSPWLYALSVFKDHLQISHVNAMELRIFDGIDSLGSRFAPFPYDGRPLVAGTAVSTPYLDAQVNFPLLLLAAVLAVEVGMLWRRRQAEGRKLLVLTLFAGTAFASLSVISMWPSTWGHLPQFLGTIQFAYRLVTYLDLSLFAAVVLLLGMARPVQSVMVRRLEVLVAVCAALALQNALIKHSHARAVEAPMVLPGLEIRGERENLLNLPTTFYAASDYGVADAFGGGIPAVPADSRVRLKVESGSDFGQILPGKLPPAPSGYVTTNVLGFPWNRLIVSGRALTPSQIRLAPFPGLTDDALAMTVPAESGTVQFQVEPPALWLWLRRISFLTLLLWASGLGISGLMRARRHSVIAVELPPIPPAEIPPLSVRQATPTRKRVARAR